MSNPFYEIVELGAGEIALKRIDSDGEPLLRVQFSDEVMFYLQEQYIEVAKAMISTGIRVVDELQSEDEAGHMDDDESEQIAGTLH